MPIKLSPEKAQALDELVRRGVLKGDRADAARELLRRYASAPPANDEGSAIAALNSFADSVTLGASGKAQSALAAGGAKLGLFGDAAQEQDFSTLYDAAEEAREQRDDRLAAEHPYANLTGAVGGLVTGGVAAGKVAAKLGYTPAKTFARRAGQYALGGGTAAATEQVIRDADLSGKTLTSGIVGGVVGAVGGGVAEKVAPVVMASVAPKTSRAWRKLAAKLRTPVEDMAAFIDDTRKATGQAPSIAQAIHARDQGVLQGWAARHNTLGTAFNEAAEKAPGQDLNIGKIEAFRSGQADATMDAQHATGVPVRDVEIDLPTDLLSDPSFNRAVPRAMRKKVSDAHDGNSRLTVSDADIIRRRLRRMEASPANLGEDFADIADELETHVGGQVGEYRQMLSDYKGMSDYGRGFKEAMAGRSATEGTGDAGRSVRHTAAGAAGHNAGAYTRQGQRSLNNMAPTTPADDNFPDVNALGRGASHMALGSKGFGMFHTARAFMDMLPESYQQELANGLLTRNPAQIQMTLGRLRKAGADLKTIQLFSAGIGTMLGATASQAAGRENGQ